MKNISIVYPEIYGGVNYHRLVNPNKELGYNICNAYPTMNWIEYLNKIPYYSQVVYTHISNVTIEIATALKQLNKILILDVDDMFHLPKNHGLYKQYQKENSRQVAIELLKLADKVTCTTEYLKKYLTDYHSDITVLPNGLYPEQCKPQRNKSDVVTFGYAGGMWHEHDVRVIEGIDKLLKGLNYQINVYGLTMQNSPIFMRLKRMLGDKCMLYPREPVERYLELYNMHDVTIAPLRNDDFNNCKSPLKIAEAGWFGQPIICSNTLPYSDYNVRLAKTKQQFADTMAFFIQYPQNIELEGQYVNDIAVKHFNLHKINEIRLNFLKSI